jgi:acetaldehyde dehydrogenase (acetylating)
MSVSGVHASSSAARRGPHLRVEDHHLPGGRGAAHYLPAYAGNLDIMTSAALATAERMAERILETVTA